MASLYSQVTFSHTPYEEALEAGQRQDRIMEKILSQEGIEANWDRPETFESILDAWESQRLTAVFIGILVGGLNGAEAQSTPFNAESQTHRNHGWTYAIGYHAFSARPDSVPAVYQTVRPSGTIDTLHAGTWGHAGNHALRLGIGYWGIARRPLIWDR